MHFQTRYLSRIFPRNLSFPKLHGFARFFQEANPINPLSREWKDKLHQAKLRYNATAWFRKYRAINFQIRYAKFQRGCGRKCVL